VSGPFRGEARSGLQFFEPPIFERSRPGESASPFADRNLLATAQKLLPAESVRRSVPILPEVSEADVVRHYTRLSQWNYGVDLGFYPLGSCTMKYNPKVNEEAAALPGFTGAHPFQPAGDVAGCLTLMGELAGYLAEIGGMDAVTLQPAAGAHGEMAGMLMVRACLAHRGDPRRKVIIPDSAHGTNPASTTLCRYEAVQVPSDGRGLIDVEALTRLMDEDTAGIMLTNPNTLGLFEENIRTVAGIVHDKGGLVYLDGANMNAVLGVARPGDWGVDVMHFNLHKTFATPHGGGGPGSGPVGVKAHLEPFLPLPVIERDGGGWRLADEGRPLSIGRVKAFAGNFLILVRAYAYILSMGPAGLREVAEAAVTNANYLRARLGKSYAVPYDRTCMHECVFSDRLQAAHGVTALDVAKRLIDHGFHPPTVYFPLIVKGALMVEPTETESLETLDAFVSAMEDIAREAAENPAAVRGAPVTTRLGRLDETRAARAPRLRWTPSQETG
jgi:glycine dehydrogenase subunit 2